MALDGLERLLEEHFGPSVKMIRYADDIIIAGVAPLQALNGIEFESVILLNSLTGDNWLAGFIGKIFSKCIKDMY